MPAPQQGGNQSDNSYAIIWWTAAGFALLAGIWFSLKDYIIAFYLSIKLYELSFFSFLASHLHFSTANFDQLRYVLTYAQANPESIRFTELLNMGGDVGVWLRTPLAILLVILAVVVYRSNVTRVYKNTYTMKSLAKLEKQNWPQISIVTNLDLLKSDIDRGPWAMAMTPLQFCKRFKLLEEIRPQRQEGMMRKDWDRVDVILKRGEANKIFVLQLGQPWEGVDKLPPHTKALFAAFAARINGDSKEAEKLFRQFNVSISQGKLNTSGVDDAIKKHINSKPIQKITQSHAYVTTVMASMLETAREDGVLASADFLWLKPLDRKLWYTLNTVGRQTPFVEVAGVFAHWISEKEAGRRLILPMIEEATNALELALREVVYKPDEA